MRGVKPLRERLRKVTEKKLFRAKYWVLEYLKYHPHSVRGSHVARRLYREVVNLSHRVYKGRGFRGHVIRQAIRRYLLSAASSASAGRGVMANRLVKEVVKLCLNLTVLAGFALLVGYGYQLFTVPQEVPLRGSVYLILGFATWVAVIILSRSRSRHYWLRYRGMRPSLKLTAFLVITVLLVLAFAGVKPFASYKDSLIGKTELLVGTATESIRDFTEDTGDAITELGFSSVIEVANYESLFNEYRQSYGLNILMFTDDLNRIAELRLREIQVNYSHNSAGGYGRHLAENICMISFGFLSDQGAFGSWKGSFGHNANMLDSSYKYTGYANGGGYAVQVFTEYLTINGEPQLPSGWYWDD